MTKLTYRPEIDGLRAIAVLVVIFYHAEFVWAGRDWFSGGYIGVDVFFVISGYLISRLLLSELTETGGVNFAHFYQRRARRILPILLTVMLASFPFAWGYLLPADFVDYAKSILSSLFFGSNFFFHLSTTEYGAASSLLKPFLHTWSLSVEEQFYLLCPAALLLIHKAARQHLLWICVVVLIASLGLAEFASQRLPSLNFYMLPTRMWELLAGTLVAIWGVKNSRSQPPILTQVLPILGLALIIWAVVSFNHQTFHPGFITIIPVLGTCLILQYSNPGSLIGKVLSAKPIVATGLLSYSLYLWHFPIFAFARIKNSSPSDSDKLGWIALTIGLSILFYFLVEKPFRQNRNMPIRSALQLIAGGGVTAMLLCGITLGANGFSSRLPAIFVDEHFTQEPWHDLKDDTGRICYDTQEGCIFTPKSTDAQRIAVIGDSHLTILANDLKNRLRDDNALYFSLLGGCPLYIEASRYNSKDIRSEKCNIETQAARMDRILTFRPDITILMARYPVSVEGKWFDNQEGGIESTGFLTIKDAQGNPAIGKAISLSMEKLLQSGSEIILIYPMPEVGWDVPKKLMAERPKNFWEFDAYLKDKPITTSYAVYQQRTKTSFAILDQIKSDQITRLYPHKLFCNTQLEGRCVTHDSTHLFYRDDDHPSAFAAGMINDLIIAEIEVAAKR